MPAASSAKPRWERLRAAPDYREFLKAYLQERGLSLSDLARATGFGRGFPGDVISGRRRLSARSSFAFEKALRLPASGKKLFRLLVARDEPDLFPGLDPLKITRGIEQLRTTRWSGPHQTKRDSESASALKAFVDPNAAFVFAALGEPENGASFEEIAHRTRLGEAELKTCLEALEAAHALKRVDERYIPEALHLYFQGESQSGLIRSLFSVACRAAEARADRAFGSGSELFFTSSVCVKESKLPELKAALRETILSFVDQAIDPSGDRVARVTTALHL